MTATFTEAEIEQAAISCLMQWPERCFPVLDTAGIGAEYFHEAQNRVLFDAVQNFWREGKPLELIAFTSCLRDLELLKPAGDAYYVTQTWCNTAYSPEAFGYYLGILLDCHARRSVVHIAHQSTLQARGAGCEAPALVSGMVSELSKIRLEVDNKAPPNLKDEALAKLQRMEDGLADEDVIATGIAKLDQESPLRNGDLALIVGERKAGKSIMALSIASNVARRGFGVLYFSLEDRTPKVLDRLFAGVSRVPMQKHHVSRLDGDEIKKVSHAAAEIGEWRLVIRDDTYDLSRLIAIAKEEHARKSLGLIVVDYAQLVRSPGRKDQNREQEVASVSRQLRLLAMESGVPIILLSQLNVDGATRESRALEQDATACWHLTTEEDEPQMRWVNIPWQRNGPSGIHFKVTFLGELARVENYAK